jgi:hypothetical protein
VECGFRNVVMRVRYYGRTDWADTNGFFKAHLLKIREKIKKKSVSIRPIRPIRSPIVSHSYHNIPKSAIHNPKSKEYRVSKKVFCYIDGVVSESEPPYCFCWKQFCPCSHRFETRIVRIILHIGLVCDTMGERIGRIGQIETDFWI